MHEAVTIHDTAIFGHLLNGEPARSLALAQEMVAFTEPVSAAWNGYFRAVALLLTMHVTGDHAAVRAEAEVLGRRRLSIRAEETRRTSLILARIDGGDELGALDLAETAYARASDDSARVHGELDALRDRVAGRRRRAGARGGPRRAGPAHQRLSGRGQRCRDRALGGPRPRAGGAGRSSWRRRVPAS